MYDGAVSTIRPNCRWLDVPRAILVAASPDAGPVKGFAYYHDICPARREPRSDKGGMFLHGGENGGVNTLILAGRATAAFRSGFTHPIFGWDDGVLGSACSPDIAFAHGRPVPGLEGVYLGMAHPLSTPPQLLALLALGLLLGQG
jgi:hypothetical protein